MHKRLNKSPVSSSRTLQGAELKQKALEMALSGLNNQQIAMELGFSRQYISQMLREELDSLKEDIKERNLTLIEFEVQRVEMIIASLSPKKHIAKVAKVILNAMTHKAKLLGLYSPDKILLPTTNGVAQVVLLPDLSIVKKDSMQNDKPTSCVEAQPWATDEISSK